LKKIKIYKIEKYNSISIDKENSILKRKYSRIQLELIYQELNYKKNNLLKT
jgi:hypothetical protein